MIAAAIDIGTNSVLLTVAERAGDGSVRVLADRAEITRLGEGVDHQRRLQPAAMQRTAAAVAAFAASARELGASRLRAVGTSALRDACNTPEFADLLRRQTGLLLEVLSGEAEALLSYRAVRDDTSLELPPNDLIVVDIGGGSAEFIHGDAAGIRFRTSLDCGAVRTTERFFHADPPTPAEIAATAQWLDAQLATLPDFPAGAPAVGIGGTFVNLAAVESSAAQEGVASLHGTVLDQTAVARQIARFAAMPTAQRRQIPGLEPKRADVILAGALLVQRILERFALPAIRVSVRGLRYGVLWEILATPDP